MLVLASLLLAAGLRGVRGLAQETVAAQKQCLADALSDVKTDTFEACTVYSDLERCRESLGECNAGVGAMSVLVKHDGKVYAASVNPPGDFSDLVDEVVAASPPHDGYTLYFTHKSDTYPDLGDIMVDSDASLAGALTLAKAEGATSLVLTMHRETAAPTEMPSMQPTMQPSLSPSMVPTLSPSFMPTEYDICLEQFASGGDLSAAPVYECKMENGYVWTGISPETKRVHVRGKESPKSFKHTWNYGGRSNSELKTFTEAFDACYQFVKYECKGSVFLGYHNVDEHYASWIDVDGKERYDWGGANGQDGCACHLTDSCANGDYKCNCNENSADKWQEDSGNLVGDGLPLIKAQAGDTGDASEEAYYTVDTLWCRSGNLLTCASIKAAGQDPDGQSVPVNNVLAKCREQDGHVWTGISPIPSARIKISGHENPKSFEQTWEYGMTVAQLKAFTAGKYCEQFVKYECKGSITFAYDGVNHYASWKDVNGAEHHNWGGAGDKQGCACQNDNSCASGKLCNCNANDGAWRADEGLLTSEFNELPLTKFHAGDTGDASEEAYVTVGDLWCR